MRWRARWPSARPQRNSRSALAGLVGPPAMASCRRSSPFLLHTYLQSTGATAAQTQGVPGRPLCPWVRDPGKERTDRNTGSGSKGKLRRLRKARRHEVKVVVASPTAIGARKHPRARVSHIRALRPWPIPKLNRKPWGPWQLKMSPGESAGGRTIPSKGPQASHCSTLRSSPSGTSVATVLGS